MSAFVAIVSSSGAGVALGEALAPLGFRVRRHASAEAALADCAEAALLAVDATDSRHEAFDGIRRLRARGYRGDVVALVDRDDTLSAVLALEMGADAFLEMPVHPRLAGAYARRALRGSRDTAPLQAGALELKIDTRTARVDGVVLPLTGSEFELLACLAQRAGQPVSRAELLAASGAAGGAGSRAIDTRVCRLRARLAQADGPKVVTLRSRGYMLATQ